MIKDFLTYIKENQNQNILDVIHEYVITSFWNIKKRNELLNIIYKYNFLEEDKIVNGNYLYRCGDVSIEKIQSYSYKEIGAKKIQNFLRKDYQKNIDIKKIPITDFEIIVNIPLFIKNNKYWGGKYFQNIINTEYEVLAKKK